MQILLFSLFFYTIRAMKLSLFILLISGILLSPSSYALEGFVGENPGLDFYTRIDESSNSIHNQIIRKHLASTPNLDSFAKWCPGAYALKWARTTSTMLDEMESMDYSSFSKIANENGQTSMSLEGFQALTSCVSNRYQLLKDQSTDEQESLEHLSSLGLYSDGDTSNSDYDIVADIDKINMILFSTPLEYDGVKNNSKKAFQNFIAGKVMPTIFEKKTIAETAQLISTTPPQSPSQSTETNNQTTEWTTLSEILGGTCVDPTKNNSPVAITDIMDENFQKELSLALGTPNSNGSHEDGGGYTKPVGNDTQNTTANTPPKTSKDDFFDTLPCSDIFCITVNMKWGSQNLLTGGKNYSIEGILDKHKNILYPIANSSLRSEKMTNNFWSLPFADMKLSDLIGGGRIYLASRPQPTRTTPIPKSDENTFEEAKHCAYAAAWLSTDPIKANGVGGSGLMHLGTAITTENIGIKDSVLWPQSTTKGDPNCVEKLSNAAREKTYQSFSNNLTQIQAFTQGFVDEIDEVMTVGTALYTKPVK